MVATDLLQGGIYTITEAAFLVGVSQQKIRGWTAGYSGRKSSPIIQVDIGSSGDRRALSFRNLMEIRFVRVFEHAGVRLGHIRSIIEQVREITRHPHPFATDIVFRTDGQKVVGLIKSQIYDLKSKNLEMFEVVFNSLKDDVEYDFNGNAQSWFPRRQIAPNVIVHPSFSFGSPILKQSKIPTRTLADAVKAEGEISIVADMYEVRVREVREAIAFENELRKAA